MNFITFIQKQAKQPDEAVNLFVNFAVNDKNFPTSSDPEILAKYLYKKLNHKQTSGFQKCLMIYKQFEQKNEIPNKYNDQMKFIDALNFIIDLQNNDPEYSDF